ncbi:multifunctional oxoglutarate decarboxylase/oxoglutarate dehydrogenase thiamine pyrophosphate-binding subunit/dihydrolipoyllysine-residue succinyltransferase subunit [Nanchangia anserum]|uniref:Multifunctional oxoglutarate decarboxylase/oxoglutarate dehydrogenase thiamine pyrophosphate-binding subunit/dihydrolipoyllysine-residue succinyltransferase subunit n=1 Tax=Nanchangia anserum TaxID=2692125 RepID=A0A8I0GHF8_9ACTO|nr:multifunctional oxoglutarate decarboxylase/oxoglutarate dehydrogenase thiamine pyrophosphate-binding subunit/dihydrolipoyllysine-residue succinyltransferase subunit [Nanchangia anserum]MBD3690049.1 multifunctional oxoglutarate decarboxylase/oxoglutarate dehydrogenase thiamine pyrophosphate-binding subunit/dihydrolipoyllysine-residue succinyltransferase subunit [Nanchangia anserum]QOX82156.1 multifunctional oxoglutarate decarboxylase/oxoglutarate dehydrogenase thiamine pyrophosphate-binding sub
MNANRSGSDGVSQQVIDDLHARYQADPASVPEDWQRYFRAVEARDKALAQAREAEAGDTDAPKAGVTSTTTSAPAVSVSTDVTRSDLPPAPKSAAAEPTSPYAAAESALGAAPGISGEEDAVARLKGPSRAVAKNMEASLSIPTATSAREIPAKLMIENRALINNHLRSTSGGKVSFTHLIAYAMVEALVEMPDINVRYEEVDGKPGIREFAHVGLGLAIDVPKKDGQRQLMVPVIHDADLLTFRGFLDAYEELVTKARTGKLTADDFAGGSVTLTNPGMIGTKHSVPRLMNGQGLIMGVGATTIPAAWAGASTDQLAASGIGPVMTITNTYDHRVIQGAASGEFLRIIDEKLSGRDGFYKRVFHTLHVPHEPYEWTRDVVYDPELEKGKPARIAELIHAYRSRGHLAANTDPLEYRVRRHPDLSLGSYGLSVWDLDRVFPTGGFGGRHSMTLRELLDQLRDTYNRTTGIEYMHIQDPVQRRWMQQHIEKPAPKFTLDQRAHILSTLNRAEAFETFLQTKYVGQKRFSLEGGEALIPLLDTVLSRALAASCTDVTIGMAHRGRLNVLTNIAGKTYAQIFSEFEGNMDPRAQQGSGDVKYHLGTEGIYSNEEGAGLRVTLAANPSHLETVDGVLEGITRAKQDRVEDGEDVIVPILIHGDAAFVGQGVVYETLNLSQLQGYRTGGTVHVIVNNQIGFTTGPTSGRSTRYCTDLAKGLQVPIFHVNGNDPEACCRAAALAFAYRQEFHKDVIIDLVCYRRRGHNEGDDPSMTQPVMYSLINDLPTPREYYVRDLVGRGDMTREQAEELLKEYHDELDTIFTETREEGWSPEKAKTNGGLGVSTRWVTPSSQVEGEDEMIGWSSAVPAQVLQRIGDAHATVPEGFTPHKKMLQLGENRQKMTREGKIDWGMGELLAFGSLLMEGTGVRLGGQDSRRGTFVQRHAVFHDNVTGREWTPLNFLTEDQARLRIYDSPLSEYAALGFEYGYAVESPGCLVVWEGQFGDFANTAQAVIDEYVSSAEQKWSQRANLVMLLPHGYEGQGPDHSSARIERYLSLAAENNMRICQPSLPANHFHLLREQAYTRPRRPLIVFTPKQLLRLSAATSPVEDFTSGSFRPVIDEVSDAVDKTRVSRVILTSGRVYYDLAKAREKNGRFDTAIVRLEQYYPLPVEELREVLAGYGDAEVVWVQDEPANQGAAPFLQLQLPSELSGGQRLRVISRKAAASPAAGNMQLHKKQNATLMEDAFA